MERRISTQPACRNAQKTGRRISGYGAVYYNGTPGTEYQLARDLVERIMPGAFDRAAKDDDVRGLFNHDPNFVLGRTTSGTMFLSTDKTGLWYDISVGLTNSGADVIEHVARGDVSGSSFSFLIPPGGEHWRRENGIDIREITAVELFDVGPVTFPAYEATTAEARQESIRARDAWHKDGKGQQQYAARERQIRLMEMQAT